VNVDYYGRPALRLSSEHLRLDVLAEAGPRIVRLMLPGDDDNLLAETPDKTWETPFGLFEIFGGHRLWHAPEASPRTYMPDSRGVRVTPTERGAVLCGEVEPATGMQKTIEVSLHSDRPAVTLHHQIENHGLWLVELAPWAITQLALGGIAVLPQRVGPVDEAGLLPNRQLVLWPYTSWRDPRLHLADDLIVIEATPALPPVKVGYLNTRGWLGYFRAGTFFLKRLPAPSGDPYPDFGCNAEVYCNDEFIELESLGPLTRVEPGQRVTHVETWEVYRVGEQPTPGSAREAIDRLGLGL